MVKTIILLLIVFCPLSGLAQEFNFGSTKNIPQEVQKKQFVNTKRIKIDHIKNLKNNVPPNIEIDLSDVDRGKALVLQGDNGADEYVVPSIILRRYKSNTLVLDKEMIEDIWRIKYRF